LTRYRGLYRGPWAGSLINSSTCSERQMPDRLTLTCMSASGALAQWRIQREPTIQGALTPRKLMTLMTKNMCHTDQWRDHSLLEIETETEFTIIITT